MPKKKGQPEFHSKKVKISAFLQFHKIINGMNSVDDLIIKERQKARVPVIVQRIF